MGLPNLLAEHVEPESTGNAAKPWAGRIKPAHMVALTLGLAATAVSALGSWIPSFWGDEAASIMSATRPLETLWPMLLRVDAVHGTYYLFLHGWIALFGASEFSVRLPSAIGMGFAVAGLVLLATRVATLRVGLFAGLVCAMLPPITRMGAEGREYAFSAACAVWLTWLLVRLTDPNARPGRGGWVIYAASVALSVYVFLFLALMVLVHATILLATPGQRRTLRPFAFAAVGGITAAGPVIILAALQRHQVAFLADRHQTTPWRLLVRQWFDNPWLAGLAWSLIIMVVAVWITHRVAGRAAAQASLPDAITVGVAWLILPCLVLLLANTAVPLYSLRYLTFAAPAAALLIGSAVALPRRSWVSWLLVAALLCAAAPTWVHQRGPFPRNGGTDWSAVAVTIENHMRPGDGVIFADNTRPSQRPRLAMHVYPGAFANARDVLLDEPYTKQAGLWDKVLPIDALPSRMAGLRRVWLLNDQSSTWGLAILREEGFQVIRVYRDPRTTIYELSRNASGGTEQ